MHSNVRTRSRLNDDRRSPAPVPAAWIRYVNSKGTNMVRINKPRQESLQAFSAVYLGF